MKFYWKPEKNVWLQSERGISFEDIEAAIASGALKAVLENTQYSNQVVLVVELVEEIWAVPAEQKKGLLILWTAYPSRKLRKIYGVMK